MTSTVATSADAGRACPYCRFAIKEGAAAERCDSCNSLHHADCWRDGGGCAVHGCPMAGTAPAAGAHGAPYPSYPPSAPQMPPTRAYGAGYGPQGYAPAQPLYPRRGVSPAVLAIATLIALIGIGTGVVVATGAFSGGAHASTRTPGVTTAASAPPRTVPSGPTGPTGPTASEARGDRGAIMSLLASYESSYSGHDVAGLSNIFSPGIARHGLAAGGCTVARGRGAVLDDYRSQFENGSGSYRLIGLNEGAIQIESKTRAHLDAHYQISPGGSGYVNFRFADLSEGWKISEVYATCE